MNVSQSIHCFHGLVQYDHQIPCHHLTLWFDSLCRIKRKWCETRLWDQIIIIPLAQCNIAVKWLTHWSYWSLALSHRYMHAPDIQSWGHIDGHPTNWPFEKRTWSNRISNIRPWLLWRSGLWHGTWWRHQMETFSALLVLCAGNSPVTGEFPAQRPVTRSFDVFFFYLGQIKRLSNQSWGWWFETPSRSLWRHCNAGYCDGLAHDM